MKKFNKNTKKGFTLLEVMLAVAIMAFASTMIMEGFIATMNCSRNSTIYSRVGSTHYAELINIIALNSNLAQKDRIYNGGTPSQLHFTTGIQSGVYIWKRATSAEPINVPGATGNAREADINSTLVDNRTAFFYIPTAPDGSTTCVRDHVGEFSYCYYAGGNAEWLTPAFRCIHEMDEYNDPNSAYYHQPTHRYCFQYD